MDNVQETKTSEVTSEATKPKSKKPLLIGLALIILLAICAAAGFGGYSLYNSSKKNDAKTDTNNEAENNDDEEEDEDEEEPKVELKPAIAFIREGDISTPDDNEVWLMDVDGKNPRTTGIKKAAGVIKQPNTHTLVYTLIEDRKIYILDLETNQSKTIEEKETDKYYPLISLENQNHFSPDGKYFLYQVNYFENCDSDGPCEYTGSEVKSGYYMYNLETGTKTHIEKMFMITQWDNDSEYFYMYSLSEKYGSKYVSSMYKVMTKDGKITLMKQGTTFGYSAVFADDTTKNMVEIVGDTNVSTKVNLTKNGVKTSLDSGKWAEIQNFLSLSPDKKYVTYGKLCKYLEPGMPIYKIEMINLTTGKKSTLMNCGDKTHFNMDGTWIGEYFYTSQYEGVDPEKDTSDIVRVNPTTGTVEKLTNFGDVAWL